MSTVIPNPICDQYLATIHRVLEQALVAVADELQGIKGKVENLRRRMIHAARFPVEWITAVESTLIQAQEQT